MTHAIPTEAVVDLLRQCSNCDPSLLWFIDANDNNGPNLEPLLNRLVRYRVLDRIAARAMLMIANGQLDAKDLKQLLSASRTRTRVSHLANQLRGAQPTARWQAPLPGTTVGQYTLGMVLGHGGCGSVYEAQHPVGQYRVAVKVAQHQRAQREAEALARLAHRNVVRLWDAVTTPHGPALVLEYLNRGSVKDRLDQGRRFTLKQTLFVATHAARGLQAIHNAGYTHGDVKPGNLMYHDRTVKVIDLGLAKRHGPVECTDDDVIEGTWAYAAPEQFDGWRDPRSDVYSLGLLVRHMLSGKPTFTATTKHECQQQQRQQKLEPMHWLHPEIPRALSQLFQAMVQRNPADRPATMKDVLTGLRHFNPASCRP
jgi:serine/threonine protein kinase